MAAGDFGGGRMILKMQSTMLELSAESFSVAGCSSVTVVVVSVRVAVVVVVVVVVEESVVVVVAVDVAVSGLEVSVTTSVVMIRLVSARTGSCWN